MPLLPTVPRRDVSALAVKKGGVAFDAPRALGLGWECFYKFFFANGWLDASSVSHVPLRGGLLEVRERGQWTKTRAVDVTLSSEQRAFLSRRVVDDHELLLQHNFWPHTGVDIPKFGPAAGFHDLFGCFWKGHPVKGNCGLERKFCFGARGFDSKVETYKTEAEKSYRALLQRGKDLAAQLLLVTQVHGGKSLWCARTVFLCYTVRTGWAPIELAAYRAAPLFAPDALWESLSKHGHRGSEYVSLPEAYGHFGLSSKNIGRDVAKWTAAGAGLGLTKKRDFPKRSFRSGSGRSHRFVVKKLVLAKITPLLRKSAGKAKRRVK